MKENLRKVQFDLNELNLTIGDLGIEDSKDVLKKRHGYFHRMGDIIVYDPQQEKNLQKTVAIIEETGTGKDYEVSPKCVVFEEPIN